MQTLIAPLINLVILLGVLAYYLRGPLKEFAKTRSVSIRDELKTVHEQLERAQQKNLEFTSKLKAMGAEISALKTQALQDAQAAKVRISADAQKASANIITDARNAAVTLYTEFKGQIYSELGNRVLDRAEALLRERLTGDDRARIRQEFTHSIQAEKS
jgi:F0F1-type ATP synthase membrane subunit b/b'